MGSTVDEIRTQLDSYGESVPDDLLVSALSVRDVFVLSDERLEERFVTREQAGLKSRTENAHFSYKYRDRETTWVPPISAHKYTAALCVEAQREGYYDREPEQMVTVDELLEVIASPSFEARWA